MQKVSEMFTEIPCSSSGAFISGTPLMLPSVVTHDTMILPAQHQAHQANDVVGRVAMLWEASESPLSLNVFGSWLLYKIEVNTSELNTALKQFQTSLCL